MGQTNREVAWGYAAHPDYRDQLTPSAKLLMFVIADMCDDQHGLLYAGERTIARKIGQSRSWVRRHRPALVKAGLLVPQGDWAPGKAIQWQLFPEVYGAGPLGHVPTGWKPSSQPKRSTKGFDPTVLTATDRDDVGSGTSVGPLKTEPGRRRNTNRDDVPRSRTETTPESNEGEKREGDPSYEDALANLLDAFPHAEVVSNA